MNEKKKGGFFRGLGIAILIFILAVLLLVLLTVFLVSPSRNQIKRLENTVSEGSGAAEPVFQSGGAVLSIPQQELSIILASGIRDALEDVPDVRFIGADIRLEDESIDLLVGASGILPGAGWSKKGTVRAVARIVMTEEGLMSVTPTILKVGRLRLPVRWLMSASYRNPDDTGFLQDLDSSGITIIPGDDHILIDPAPLLGGTIPGMSIRHIRAVRGSLRIALDMPETLTSSIDAVLLAVSESRAELMSSLADVLPADHLDDLEKFGSFLASVPEIAAGEPQEFAVVSYLEGSVAGRYPGSREETPLDYGDRLPAGARVSCGRESYAELALPDNHVVRVMEQTTLVIEETASQDTGATILALLSGKARVLVSSLKKDHEFRLKAPDAVMAVRGTDFVVIISRGGSVTLAVLEGEVAVNDSVTAVANREITVEKGVVANPLPISPALRDEIAAEMKVRTLPGEFQAHSYRSIAAVGVPHLMEAAAIWAELDNDTQWEVQYAIEDHIAAHPEIQEAVDEFFRVNNLEERRDGFEAMFE